LNPIQHPKHSERGVLAKSAKAHSRDKVFAEERALIEGQSEDLLKALHILTREGRLNQDAKRKLKQVNHLVQLMSAPMQKLYAERGRGEALKVVDHGAGKSYLGFILYDRFQKNAALLGDLALEVYGLELRAELVERSRQLAQEWGFGGMHFLHLDTQEARASALLPKQVDVVTALHACDTASDDAIEFALAKRARLVFIVPCCQAEFATALRAQKALSLSRTPLAELWRHPLHTREMGSQLTNVMRCLYLQSQGYQVTVTELVGWEHSMKNELIVASLTPHKSRAAGERLQQLMSEFGLEALGAVRFAALNWGEGEGAGEGYAEERESVFSQNQSPEV
jgi:hypothetical protein